MTRISRSDGAGPRAAAAFVCSCGRAVEALERRVLLSTLTVSTTNDSGPGSLRQAILDANSRVGTDTIAFNIPGVGVQTIAPTSPLPLITDQVIIDGTTQPGYSAATGAPVVELSGVNAGPGAGGLIVGAPSQALTNASGSQIKGLIINRFAEDGIVVEGGNVQVRGCYIGTNAVGDAPARNGGNGITIVGTEAHIGGSTTGDRNVISGNAMAGIDDLSSGAVITGNYIGTNAIGSAAVGNGHEGIRLLLGATIGGPGAMGNVISGNGYSGIAALGISINPVQILGNFIGTDATGTTALGNGASPAAPYRDGVTTAGSSVQIGRLAGEGTPAVGNVISGNRGAGIAMSGFADAVLQVVANLIGTDATGNAVLGNAGGGIVSSAQGLHIGAVPGLSVPGVSILAAGGNVISGNSGDGVLLLGNSNSIQGNYIGTSLSGAAPLPNTGNGIEIQSSFNFVGQDAAAGNVISGNGANGILIDNIANRSAGVARNRIADNLIGTDASGNAALGNAANGILIIGGNATGIVGFPQRRQVISGNGAAGISLRLSSASNLPPSNAGVFGNYIGINLSGSSALGNAGNGVEDFNTTDMIGQAGNGNVISGNGGSGVYLGEPTSTLVTTLGDRVMGNRIGTNVLGAVVAGMGNAGDGVTVFRSNNNTVGGPVSSANIIAGNGGNGVTVDSGGIMVAGNEQLTSAIGNVITQNSIFSNGRLGIDLGNDGVTPNHPPAVPPFGPNLFANFPVILSATSYPTFTLVRFQVPRAATASHVEFFTNDVADPSGYGEGQRFVLASDVASGATAAVHLPQLPVGTIITATATDSSRDTSEFSLAVATIAPPPIVTASSFNPQNNTIAFTFNKDVSASLSPSAVRVHNLTTGNDVAVTGVTYDSTTNTATFQLPGTLPGGSYVVTLLARAVTDSTGEHLDGNNDGTPGDDYTFQFSSVSGDVNLDGAVALDDLLILAQHYGQAGTFAQGDLNHDGRIDFADLLILAQSYGRGAAAAAGKLR